MNELLFFKIMDNISDMIFTLLSYNLHDLTS